MNDKAHLNHMPILGGNVLGELIALLSAVGFSLSIVMVKKGTKVDSKNNGAFISILLTAMISGVLLIILGLSRGWPLLTQEGMIWFILAGIFTSFFGRSLLYSAIQQLGSVRSTAIKRLNPFFAVILGVLLLGEPLTIMLLIGMTVIFVSLGILYQDSYQANIANNEGNEGTVTEDKKVKSIVNIGYVYGISSAACYALGYVLRKNGLLEIPDPFLGSMVGAGVGCLVFVVMALFQKRYRYIVKSSFSHFEPWLIGAGIMVSVGQILYFVALSYTAVSRVALIASIEVIFTILLSAWVFKTRESLTRKVIFASLLSMVGAGIIAVG